MKHYTEVELLEQYYLGNVAPGLAEHVNACTECLARFRRLADKLSCSAEAHRHRVDAKPAGFWFRQSEQIAAKLREGQPVPTRPAIWRLAVAAILALLAGAVVFVNIDGPEPAPEIVQAPGAPTPELTAAVLEDNAELEDPWEADALQPYAEVVEWESWLTETQKEGTS